MWLPGSKAIRSYLKNVFWPKLFVGAVFQFLEILEYSSGLKHGPAAILNQNPIFEMASSHKVYSVIEAEQSR
jgi:hypothetical protein